jgi:hypothetical protein
MSSTSFHAATFTVESASDSIGNAAIIVVGGVPDHLLNNKITNLDRVDNLLDLVALNPQPLPPEPPDITFAIASQIDNLSDLVALNPQPLPPEPPDRTFGISFGISKQLDNPLDLVGLNPQPLPPRELFGSVSGNVLFRFGH